MRSAYYAAGAALLACTIAGFAETEAACGQTLMQPLQPGAALVIDSKPAEIEIVGTDQEAIHVSCTTSSDENSRDVHFHFSPSAHGGKLSIQGVHSSHGGVEVKIEVPRRTNLKVRMFAGEVKVAEVKGDNDIEIGAGQITIASIHGEEYRSVDASVMIGEIQARAFGGEKGGFFRGFSRKNASGDYRLHAHVTTGEIDLLGHAEQSGGEAKPD